MGAVTSTHPVRIGLNYLHAYWHRWSSIGHVEPLTKYGGDTAPYADARALGATIARQVGLRDLMWGTLAPDLFSLETFQRGQAVELDVEHQLNQRRPDTSQRNVEWLAESLLAAHGAQLKVILNFISRGQSGVLESPMPMPSYGWERTVADSDGTLYDLEGRRVDVLRWDEDHLGRTIEGARFPVILEGPRMPSTVILNRTEWHLASLDVSSGYKRVYLREIGFAVGELLAEADALLQEQGVSLHDVVEGIELFNEVDTCNRYIERGGTDAESRESGSRWGRACFHAAYGLRLGLGEDDGCGGIRILLPGIASYKNQDNERWPSRKDTLEGLVSGFVAEAVEYLHISTEGPQVLLEEIREYLPSLLQGIDYHYYHTGALTEPDHDQHIGYLITEVPIVEHSVVDAARVQWEASTGRPQTILDFFPVSVMETGTSAIAGQCFFPASLSGLTSEQFQAWEVIRRLGGALASGARMVGWHSWMAGDTPQFAGFGLREDTQEEDAPPMLAQPRASWFAYQRLASLLGSTVSGDMALPEIDERADLEAFLRSPDRHPFVVFRYEGAFEVPRQPGYQRYAWLVLREPTVLQTSLDQHLYGRAVSSTRSDMVWQVPILDPSVSLHHPSSGAGLPSRSATYAPSVAVRLSSWVEFLADPTDAPLLLVSDVEIDWKVETGFSPMLP